MSHAAAKNPTYLFVLSWSLAHLGGVNQVVINLAREMQQHGRFRPVVLICDWDAVTPVWETMHGIATVRWRIRPETPGASTKARFAHALWRLRFAPMFRRFCAEHHVAVINPHYANDSAFTLQRLAADATPPLPVLVSFHGADLTAIENGTAAERERWQALAGRARAFVACSQALAKRLVDTLGGGLTPAVVHNGLDADAFIALAGSEGPPVAPRRRLLSVGKFEAKKGQDILLHAFAVLRPVFTDLELLLVGATDHALPALRTLADTLGVADAVRFLPDTPHHRVAGLFRDATVFVLPSRQEPFGIVLLEAGSFALPVVASAVGGIPEVLTDGETGRLVPPDDPAALADALRAVLSDPAASGAMGHRLQHAVRTRFTWAAALDRYLALATAPFPRDSSMTFKTSGTATTATTADNRQSAYHRGRVDPSADVDRDLADAMRRYLVEDLGIDAAAAEERASKELARRIPKAVLALLAERGITADNRDALDLGAGLGGMSEELMLQGARLVALEPGGNWAELTRRRLDRHGKPYRLLNAYGEAIPLPDASVDLIISLQVLEHVRDPVQVLGEAFRVLRPGGHFLLACENYLAFWEPHYRLPWLPLMPKPVGSLYLRALGRSPDFLREAITYTTFAGVVRTCRRIGFVRARDEEIRRSLQTKTSPVWRALGAFGKLTGGRGPLALDDARNWFKVGITEVLRKPGTPG